MTDDEGGSISPYYAEPGIELYHGDSLRVVPTFRRDRFATVCCDPPYGLGFMGKEWDHGVPGVPFWDAALRVTKPGGTLMAFGGTRTFHRLAVAIEDAGWEIRDCLMWMYGTGFPKSLNVSKAIGKSGGGIDAAKQWEGWGTALKPAYEPIILARKPTDGTFAENAIKHGVVGMNIDGARIPGAKPDTTRGAGGQNGAFSPLAAMGRIEDDGRGRWPANVVLDAEAAAVLDAEVGTLTSGKQAVGGHIRNADKTRGVYNPMLGQKCEGDVLYGDSGGPSRFFYTAKASRDDRGDGNPHTTVKPTDLIRWLLTLTDTPTHGEVLDLFAGSCTTAIAAREVGRPCVCVDREVEYIEFGKRRLQADPIFFFDRTKQAI